MENPFTLFNLTNLLVVPGILIGYAVHELGHALTAYFLGDHSQVEEHKITLNPLEHVAWIGAFAFILLGIGWPKPMYVNLHNLKQRHRDMLLIAIAGPIASFTLTLVGFLITLTVAAAAVYRSGAPTNEVILFIFPLDPTKLPQTLNTEALVLAFTWFIIKTSLILTFWSLLPIPGQDGFTAITSLIALFRARNKVVAEGSQTRSQQKPFLMAAQQKRRNKAADIHFQLGTEYHKNEQYDDAIARYRQAISNDASFGPAYINMGLAYSAKNDRPKAIQAFRAATQYADDRRSQMEAWRQLQELSEIIPIDPDQTYAAMAEMGATPWTDTKPRPNWWGLGVGGGLILISAIIFYSYLVAQLTELLKT